VRSVFFNVFQSLVVLLYVLDNETNFVVKISIFIGLAIELWKIHKVVDIKVNEYGCCMCSFVQLYIKPDKRISLVFVA